MPSKSAMDNNSTIIHWIGHRGYPVAYPENSIIGINGAIEAGANYVEIDIQFSADNHPVIYHDPTLDRVSGRTGRVDMLLLKQLLTIPAHHPERFGDKFSDNTIEPLTSILPLLEEHPNLVVFFEIKRHSLDRVGRHRVLEQMGTVLDSVREQSVIISFDQPLVQAAIETQQWQTGVVINCQEQLQELSKHQLNPEFIFLKHQFAETLDLTALRQYRLVAYEVSQEELANELVKQGFHWLETDDIGLMKSHSFD